MNLKKDKNNIHDKSYKDLYSNSEVFLDLVKGMLKAPWAKDLKSEDLILTDKSYIASDYEEQESDIVYRATINGTEVIFYILLEFQSSIDYRMPLRLLFYICEILREYSKNQKHKPYNKNLKIPAVIPIVLYNGKIPWDVPTNFKDIIYNSDIFGNNIIDFKYDLFDVNNKFSKEDLLKSKSMTSAIFLLDQKIDALEFLERIKSITLFFNNLNEKEMQVLKHWIKNSIEMPLADEAIKILNSERKDVETMVANNAFILTESLEKAEEKGIEKGIEKVALEMIKDGVNAETIMKFTKLSKENIEELRRSIKH
ncbi:Rpn family recombination-promoting nuclease/putative transposase [Clostridium tarantellae]|uniref:Transposase n=1 Tax=Clostridium tarantellae TaxID=39493 RepID=A0A6I1MN57_9CLOT|nr:Rpn family recombination-promoting nuclease/putative transposase [Clostridium tarantellae]MPQ43547.1 transposase [Clostridium tarantellae]